MAARIPYVRTHRATLALATLALAPAGAAAQEPAAPPGSGDAPAVVADEFHRAFQSMAWAGLAGRLHPEALAYLRLAVRITLDADTTSWTLDRLLGGVADRAAYDALTDADVVRRVMQGVQAEVPGLLSSLVSRRSQILGTVLEGPDTAHVVYRIVSLAQGAEPRVRALTLVRTPRGWKVRFAEEVDVLHTALRRIPVPRQPPSGSGGASLAGPG